MDAPLQPRDGREIAAEHDTQVLRWLARFGWLSARQIGRLVWPNASQAQRMSQRALRRLVGEGAVLRRPLPTGGVAYVLGQRGARRLRDAGHDSINARGYRDLRFNAPVHRSICNDYAIDRLIGTELEVHMEMEIQRGAAPTLHLPFEGRPRIPDLLIGQDGDYEWIEVERASKSRSRLDKLVAFADYLLAPEPNEALQTNLLVRGGQFVGHVGRFRFVCHSGANVRACWRAFERHGHERLLDHCPHDLVVERVHMSTGLVWGGSVGEGSVSELVRHFAGEDGEESGDARLTS
jgi:hypothetical protein